MKTINKLFTMAVLLTAGLIFTSCSKDDDDKGGGGQPQKEATIIGEWFQDASAGDVKQYSAAKYNEDGSAEFMMLLVTTTESLYYNYNGSYSLKGSSLSESYVSPITGENATDKYEVVSLDKYALTVKFLGNNATDVMNRIVDNYSMTVGDSKNFGYSADGFSPTAYKTSDEAIVRVSASGSIEAVKRGTAYVSATSAEGTAVIRVTVTDPDNYIDDFMSFIGGPIDNVTKVYGNHYIEVPNTLVERTYALADELVESAMFAYFGGTVLMANVQLREGVDSEAIISSFKKKYTLYKESKNVPVFSTVIDGQEYRISYFISLGTISYMPNLETPEPEPGNYSSAAFEQFDGLIMMGKADAAAKAFGITLTEENMEDGWFDIEGFDNEVFRQVSVMFNEDPDDEEYMNITTIMLFTKRGIKQADIEQWYATHYTATGDEKNPYQSNTSPVYYISFKESGSSTTVYYKFRKNK